VLDVLRRHSGRSAPLVLAELVAAVDAWVGPPGCSDDLTALVLGAR